MKFRPKFLQTSHQQMFETTLTSWYKKGTLGMYSLQWGIEHGLLEKNNEEVLSLLCNPSFLRAFHYKHRINPLVIYWHIIAPQEDGHSYELQIQSLLHQSVNIKRARQIETMMQLFSECSWNEQGAKHIDAILDWIHPLEPKYPKLLSSLKMNKGHFLLSKGEVLDGLSGYMQAMDVLTNRDSKSAAYLHHLFLKIQNAISRGRNIDRTDYQEMWTSLQKTFPLHNRNRFSFELMILEYIFETIDEQIAYIEKLRDRISIIDDPKAKIGYKELLELNLEEKKFKLLFANTLYKEALVCGNILMKQVKSLSLSEQVRLLCTIGLCHVHLTQRKAANIIYEQLKEHWLNRLQNDRNLLSQWYVFSEGLGKSYARYLQKNKEWEKALHWSNIEVEATLWNLNYLKDSAKSMGLPINGNKQNLYAISVYQRGNINKALKRYSSATEDYNTSIQALEELHIYPQSIYRKNLSLALYMLGVLCELEKKIEEGLYVHQQALTIRSQLREVRHDMQEYWCTSATKVSSLMWKKYSSNKQQYVEELISLLSLRKELYTYKKTTAHSYDVVLVLSALGCVFIDRKEWRKALPYFIDSHQHMNVVCASEPTTELYKKGHRKIVLRRSLCHVYCNERQEAFSLLETISLYPTEEDLVSQIENWMNR